MTIVKITISTESDTTIDEFLLEDSNAARGGDHVSFSTAVKNLLDSTWNVVEIEEEDDEAEDA
jgi:hypothetical protein